MRKALLSIIVVLASCVVCSAEDRRLEIVSEEEWKPYIWYTNGIPKGYSHEVLDRVFRQMGIVWELEKHPWKRALKKVMGGKADGLFNASRKTDREAACHYPEIELFHSQYAFYITKENTGRLKFDTLDDLEGHTVGVALGYAYTEEFWNFVRKKGNYDEAKNDKLNFLKLAKGKIDYFPAEIGNAKILLRELDLSDKIVRLRKPLTQKPYYLIFSKSRVDKKFVGDFSRNLESFKKTDTFKEIYEKYFE